MYSYPEPDPAARPNRCRRSRARSSRTTFDAIYGAWWGTLIGGDGKAIVERSAERYAGALRGELP